MKDFTAQQKEVVARKLGYDGPMQGFDEFLASSPALEAKYAAITGKFTERMARGGLIKLRKFAQGGDVLKFAAGGYTQDVINQALRDEIAARPDTNPNDLAAYAKAQYGLTDAQIAKIYGVDRSTVGSWRRNYKHINSPASTKVFDSWDVIGTRWVSKP